MEHATQQTRPRPPAAVPVPATPAGAGRHLPPSAGFWVVAAAYAALSAFGTAPTPLWTIYQQVDRFGPLWVTIAFAIMVAGIILSLVFLGHLSDRLGRRRIIAPALFLTLAAGYVLIAWTGLAGLLTGRLLTGLGVGLMAASATAYLADLDRQARPHVTAPKLPGLVAAGASLGGLALGPLLAGAIAEWLPDPLRTPYVILGLLVLVCLALVLVTPETVDLAAAPRAAAPRMSLRPGRRAVFTGATLLGFAAFGASGVFSSVGALVIRDDLGIHDVFVGGLATFAVFGASAAAQLVLGRLGPRLLTYLGLLCYLAGLAATSVSIANPSLALFLAAAAVTGAGTGMLFKNGLSLSAESAAHASRAGVLSVFFVVAYLGMGLLSITFGLLVGSYGSATTIIVLSVVLALIAVAGTVLVPARRVPPA
ncbi:MFS transporter [Amycolatopsis sp. NBC_00345]|uniref:MFS transporter n=1 Tax=Amycolatopsis sp. NBC_00345 TaxID=2975955 RepID=UPI002E257981